MLTSLTIRNFKRFAEVEVELGNPVVFIGPNNSGKTTALQALALWNVGLKRWNEKRGGEKTPKHRPGVTINRRDLLTIPVPTADLLWKNLHVRESRPDNGKRSTKNVCIAVIVRGVIEGKAWECGLEFDYANVESFYCRPLRLSGGKDPLRMPIPQGAAGIDVAMLPPMSGLTAVETRLDPGAVQVRIGEGRTAEVLRNLCYCMVEVKDATENWECVRSHIRHLFGVDLLEPMYVVERGEITMGYREGSGPPLDLSCSGRGLQQTLLLLAYLYANPGSVLLLDEPDAHLEILRQRDIYRVLTRIAQEQGSQIVAASHSEVLLNEAGQKDVVVAFVGKPHRIDDRASQVLKSLKDIGFNHYYQAEQMGWILYLEGTTDLAILLAFARRLKHPAEDVLERPFVHHVGNRPKGARDHFHGLLEAKPDLVGFALFDHLDRELSSDASLDQYQWRRREIENYLCQPETLQAFAEGLARKEAAGPIFEDVDARGARETIQSCIEEYLTPAALRDANDPWWKTAKITDDFLDRVFEAFYERRGLSVLFRKKDYHELAEFVPLERIDPEVTLVLDAIVKTAQRASPLIEDNDA